jgi:hypothetical protein
MRSIKSVFTKNPAGGCNHLRDRKSASAPPAANPAIMQLFLCRAKRFPAFHPDPTTLAYLPASL